jgi:hypothetical protein
VLALALGGRTIQELQACMTQAEFHSWSRFYALYPFDDYHRFHRPAALIAQSMAGGEIQDRLNWLQPDPSTNGLTDADMTTLKAFGFTRKGG